MRLVGNKTRMCLLCLDCASQYAAPSPPWDAEGDPLAALGFRASGDDLDEQISGAPFEALMNACFAREGFNPDEDEFSEGNWSDDEDSFADDEPLESDDPNDSDPFADDAALAPDANLFRQLDAAPPEADAVCSGCGASWEQIALDERVGCARCYATFRASLAALLEQVQRQALHRGKTPRAARQRELRREHLEKRREHQLALLRNRLSDAVQAERYEEAATLRDRIKAVSEN